MRVVSLIASSTEIVCALGLGERLVGRSHECDFPLWVSSLPRCTETKFGPDGKSYEIDSRIKAILQEGLSVYGVDGELLARLRPDVILTQIQCEVCAVSRKDVEAACSGWLAARGQPVPRIVSLETHCLADLWRDIRLVAGALGEPARGDDLVARQYFNRPGPRLVESMGILAEIFHGPRNLDRGEGWARIPADA